MIVMIGELRDSVALSERVSISLHSTRSIQLGVHNDPCTNALQGRRSRRQL
jgi:hypothetical protein